MPGSIAESLPRGITKRSVFVSARNSRSRNPYELRRASDELKGRTEDGIINEKETNANEVWVPTCHVEFTVLALVATKRELKSKANKVRDRLRFYRKNAHTYFESLL